MVKPHRANAAARAVPKGDNVIPFRRQNAGGGAAPLGPPRSERDLVDIADLAVGGLAPGWRGGEATASDLWVGVDVLESLAGGDAALPLADDFDAADLEQLIRDGKDETR